MMRGTPLHSVKNDRIPRPCSDSRYGHVARHGKRLPPSRVADRARVMLSRTVDIKRNFRMSRGRTIQQARAWRGARSNRRGPCAPGLLTKGLVSPARFLAACHGLVGRCSGGHRTRMGLMARVVDGNMVISRHVTDRRRPILVTSLSTEATADGRREAGRFVNGLLGTPPTTRAVDSRQ